MRILLQVPRLCTPSLRMGERLPCIGSIGQEDEGRTGRPTLRPATEALVARPDQVVDEVGGVR